MAVFPIAVDASVFGWLDSEADSERVLEEFVAAGGNLVSTADHYAGGRSERMIGSWLRREDHRDRVVLATKVGSHPDSPGLSARAIRHSVEASLARLGTDHVDLVSFDGDDPDTPVEESLTAAAELIAEGRFDHLGASQPRLGTLREAAVVAERLDIPGFEVVLQEYNLLEREPFESEYEPFALARDIGVFARLPLASGFLSGAQRPRRPWGIDSQFAGALRYSDRRSARVRAAVEYVADQLGVAPGHVALAWVLARPSIVAPIVRARSGERLLQLLSAVNVVPTAEQLRYLDEVSAK